MATTPDIDLSQYEVTDKDDGTLELKHKNTGKTFTLKDDGTLQTDSVDTDVLNSTWHYPLPADGCPGIREVVSKEDPGDTVCLLEGEYEPDRTFSEGDNILIDKPLRLTGSGEGSVIKTPDGFTSTDGVKLIRSEATVPWVQFDHFKIDGNRQNNATNATNDGHNLKPQGGNVFVHHVVSVNSTGDGVAASGNNLLLHNNRVEDSYENNIHVNRGENVLIVLNTVRGEQQSGSIRIYPINSSNVVENCIIGFNTVTDAAFRAIDVLTNGATFKNLRITENIVDNPANYAIRVSNDNGGEVDAVVSDNTCINGGTHLIKVRQTATAPGSTPQFTVRGNTAKYGGGLGVYAELQHTADCIIENNDAHDNDGHGVGVYLTDNPAGIVSVKDNTAIDNNADGGSSRGVFVTGSGLAHDAVIVDGNETHSVDNTHATGVRVDNIAAATVSAVVGNIVSGGSADIEVLNGTPDYVKENTPAVLLSSTPKAEEGNWYWDDGTNTGSGTPGKRAYLNGGWVDAFTA